MYAARNGHFETTQHLLGLPGIDPNKCNKIGCNALHYAAQNAHKDVCELLRKAGWVNRRLGDRTMLNRTPKDMALREERCETTNWPCGKRQWAQVLVGGGLRKDYQGGQDHGARDAFDTSFSVYLASGSIPLLCQHA